MTRSELIQKLLGEVSMIKLSLRANDPLVPIIEPHRYEEYEFLEQLLLAEQKRSEGCAFCCYTEYPDATLYPREKSEFYAGRSRQVEVDEFDEDELDDVSFCPHCGRNLTEGESV